ncbi:hypothetical protein V6N13_040644 [Hibiscus sabdariffa]
MTFDLEGELGEGEIENTAGSDKGKEKRDGSGTGLMKRLENAVRLEEAKKDPEKGQVIAKKHSWKVTMERAAEIKVHDDPKQQVHDDPKLLRPWFEGRKEGFVNEGST